MRPESNGRRIPALLVAAGAAIIALVAIGGVMLLGGGDEQEVVATTATSTTMAPTTTATTAAPLPTIEWTEVDLPARVWVQSIIEAGPGLVATGCEIEFTENTDVYGATYWGWRLHSAIWTSPDGTTWTERLTDDAVTTDAGCISDVVETTDGLVAVGTAETSGFGGVVWLSEDGTAWERIDPEDMQGGGQIVVEIEQGTDGTLIAAGSGGLEARVWFSQDGRAWTRVPDSDLLGRSYVEDLAASPIGFLMVGTDWSSEYFPKPAVWYSPNGVDWERTPAGNITSDDPVAAVGQIVRIEALGDGSWIIGDLAGRVWRSDDATDWTLIHEPGLVGEVVPGVDWTDSAGRVVTVRTIRGEESVWVSVDGGQTWFEDDSSGIPGSVTIGAVFSFGDGLVAIGNEVEPLSAVPDPEDKSSTRLWIGTWDD
jgi:hypothetical protein